MQTITLPLNEFLRWATRSGGTVIPESFVDLIIGVTKNSSESGYFVEQRGDLPPRLWIWSEWNETQSNLEKQRAYSQRQRDERFVFDANVKVVVSYVKKFFGLEGDMANIIATRYLRTGNLAMLQLMGMEPDELYKDIKEVP